MRRKEFTDYPFDKDKFKETLIRARGARTQARFSDDTGLSYAYINKYMNGKKTDPPTVGTLKKIAVATETVSFEELLVSAGYDAKKYKSTYSYQESSKDFFHPIFLGMAQSSLDWHMESEGFKDNEPFEITIEQEDVKKWFFIPVTKQGISKEDIQTCILNQPKFTPGSKVSFITDNDDIYETLKLIEFPLLSICISVIKVQGPNIIEETKIKTSIDTDITLTTANTIRPYRIE